MPNYFERQAARQIARREYSASCTVRPRTSLRLDGGRVVATHETRGQHRCLTCARAGVPLRAINVDDTARHTFIDVEALGPPGIGDIFAIGAARFDWFHGGIHERRQWNIDLPRYPAGDTPTLKWILAQSPAVQAQLTSGAGYSFAAAWAEVLDFLCPPGSNTYGQPVRTVVWADDWSDFAWLDFAARQANLPVLRGQAIQSDSTPIVMAGGFDLVRPARLIEHVAVDDAEFGALQLLTSAKSLANPNGSGDINMRFMRPVQIPADWQLNLAAREAGVPVAERVFRRPPARS